MGEIPWRFESSHPHSSEALVSGAFCGPDGDAAQPPAPPWNLPEDEPQAAEDEALGRLAQADEDEALGRLAQAVARRLQANAPDDRAA